MFVGIDSELAWNLGFNGYIHLTPITQQGDNIMTHSQLKLEIIEKILASLRQYDSDKDLEGAENALYDIDREDWLHALYKAIDSLIGH